jgi:hypothetical protein
MLKQMAVIAIGIGMLVVMPDPAAGQDLEFVGYTKATRSGQAGVVAFHQECSDQFGATSPGARACTSADVIGSPLSDDFADDPNETSNWVLPSFVQNIGSSVVDASGRSGSPKNLSCDGWNSNLSSVTGLAMFDSGIQMGRFLLATCNTQRNIACCAPVDEGP